jgi:hypothetical protein
VRAKRKPYIPVVLSRNEIDRVVMNVGHSCNLPLIPLCCIQGTGLKPFPIGVGVGVGIGIDKSIPFFRMISYDTNHGILFFDSDTGIDTAYFRMVEATIIKKNCWENDGGSLRSTNPCLRADRS